MSEALPEFPALLAASLCFPEEVNKWGARGGWGSAARPRPVTDTGLREAHGPGQLGPNNFRPVQKSAPNCLSKGEGGIFLLPGLDRTNPAGSWAGKGEGAWARR